MRSKCSNRRRGLSTNYSSCSARCAARAGRTHTHTRTHTHVHTRVPPFSLRVWIEVHERVQRRRFQRVQRLFHSFREPREYHVLDSQSPSSCPVCHDRPSWTRDSGPTGWRMDPEWRERKRAVELKERTNAGWNCDREAAVHEPRERRRQKGMAAVAPRVSKLPRFVSPRFGRAVKVLSFVPRFESCRRSRRQELVCKPASHSHALLSRIYRPPVFPVLSARGIP